MAPPEFPCADCGTNTVPLEGGREYYEVLDSVWADAGAPGIGQEDNGPDGFFLCISCLEQRLDRRLTADDFKSVPANEKSHWSTGRLNDLLPAPRRPAWKPQSPQYVPAALAPFLGLPYYANHAGALVYPEVRTHPVYHKDTVFP
jgi:hypothetical protein